VSSFGFRVQGVPRLKTMQTPHQRAPSSKGRVLEFPSRQFPGLQGYLAYKKRQPHKDNTVGIYLESKDARFLMGEVHLLDSQYLGLRALGGAFGVQGSGLRVKGTWIRVYGVGGGAGVWYMMARVKGLGCMVAGVQGAGCRVARVQGSGCRVYHKAVLIGGEPAWCATRNLKHVNVSVSHERWSSNPSGKCSYERPTRSTVCGTMRGMCGAGAACLAMNYQSL
jgi:hypothetical protein